MGNSFTTTPASTPTAAGPSYLTLDEAVALRATTIPLKAWDAASDSDRTAALVQATSDIDNAFWYQGRPYDPAQDLEFPRVAYESRSRLPAGTLADTSCPTPDVVWDWDSDTNTAVVPLDVQRATLFQADSLLAGDREQRLADQHDGLSGQAAAGVSESYRPGDGLDTGLTRRAFQLMVKYQVRTGRMK